MSILLDALRKSEQRERLGDLPDIHDAGVAPSSASRPPWVLPALAVLVIMLLLAGGYVAWRSWAQPRVPVAEPELAPQTADATPVQEVAPNATAPETPTASDPTTPRLDRQPRSPVETLSGDRPYRPASQPEVNAAAREPAASRNPDVAINDERPPAEATAPARSTVDRTPSETGPIPAADSKRGSQDDDPAGLVSFWQLPQNVRSGLPELKINVMVYNDDPERRFIIMGGKRYREGTEIQRNLTLEEVQRDRALFRHGAYLFYVKQ